MGRLKPDENVTFRLDPDVVMWARIRALTQGRSLNRVIRIFLERYAAVPERWWAGKPPPWSPGGHSDPGWDTSDPLPDGLDGPNRLVVEAVAAVSQRSEDAGEL